MNVNDIIIRLQLAALSNDPCILSTTECKRLLEVLHIEPENLVEKATEFVDHVTTVVYPIWTTDWLTGDKDEGDMVK